MGMGGSKNCSLENYKIIVDKMSCEKSKEKTKRSYGFLPFLTESHINEKQIY